MLNKIRWFLTGMLALAVIITLIPPVLGIEIRATTYLAIINLVYRSIEWIGRKTKKMIGG